MVAWYNILGLFIWEAIVRICTEHVFSHDYLCLRALEILQEINQSANRRSSFSELAMTTLLNSNLPVKYNRTRRLSANDIIMSGFYDAGQVCLLKCEGPE